VLSPIKNFFSDQNKPRLKWNKNTTRKLPYTRSSKFIDAILQKEDMNERQSTDASPTVRSTAKT